MRLLSPIAAAPHPPPVPLARPGRPNRVARRSTTKVRAMVLTAAGVNCDRETLDACRLAGAEVDAVHLNELLEGARRLADFSFLILPGGFSYGDHLGAGAMLAAILRHRFLDQIERFVADGRPVLGICNGFQVLARLGLLGEVALAPNLSGRFECRWVRLRVEGSPCLFLRGLDDLELPIAHGEGRVVTLPERLPEVLPLAPLRYRENPNGSIADIAGVCNAGGNVFGLMPHPERCVSPHQHPSWHRGGGSREGGCSGLTLFRNAVRDVRDEP